MKNMRSLSSSYFSPCVICQVYPIQNRDSGCGPLDVTNASKHSNDQSENRILQINQSKNALKYS